LDGHRSRRGRKIRRGVSHAATVWTSIHGAAGHRQNASFGWHYQEVDSPEIDSMLVLHVSGTSEGNSGFLEPRFTVFRIDAAGAGVEYAGFGSRRTWRAKTVGLGAGPGSLCFELSLQR